MNFGNARGTHFACSSHVLVTIRASLLLLYIIFFFFPIAASQSIEKGAFKVFAYVGRESSSNDEPVQLVKASTDAIIVGGTTSPLERGTESDLGFPLSGGLQDEDIFLARINLTTSGVDWVYRIGTPKEDRLHAMYLGGRDQHLYVAGRSFGSFPGAKQNGQSDIFIVKYDISGSAPVEVWTKPFSIGTAASEAVTSLVADPHNEEIIYATGFTSGKLFPGRDVGDRELSDAFLFSFSALNGTILKSTQFGTDFADQGTGIVVSDDKEGPIFVSVVTDRQIGQYAFGNFHLYKLSRNYTHLGDILLRTYSREQVSAFAKHPFLPKTLLVSGSSWLDPRNGYDVFVKRVVRAFDNTDILSVEVDIDDVGIDEYTRRIRSSDGSHDYASGMIVHPDSGRLVVCGFTAGSFAQGASSKGILAPFIALIDPVDGSMTDARQLGVRSDESWVEISSIAMTDARDGVYFVAKESNETTNQFHLSVGLFRFPSSWNNPISIPPSAGPSPSPRPSNGVTVQIEQEAPIALIAGASCGAFVVVTAVVAIAISLRIRKRSRGAEAFDPGNIRKALSRTQSREEYTPLDGPKVEGRNSSGLV